MVLRLLYNCQPLGDFVRAAGVTRWECILVVLDFELNWLFVEWGLSATESETESTVAGCFKDNTGEAATHN